MAAGDIKAAYAASADLTVTNLHSLAASATHVAGWESALIDNSTNLYDDYRITAKITLAAASLAAGEVRLWLVGMLDDTNWPDPFDGTESAETVVDVEQRDSICKLGALAQTDTDANGVYYLDCSSAKKVFGGNLPHKFVVFVTQSTTQALAAAGNQVTVKGRYNTVAQ
jgi:hypothetical protein